MSKKLMLLAAGALSALAFAALPAVSSAEEYQAHCPTTPCIGTIAGTAAQHAIRLESDNGDKIDANAVAGNVEISAATTTTATTSLEFKEVKEKVSGFNFACNSPGAGAGIIKTGPLSTHFINLGKSTETIPAVLLTLPSAGITFSCAGGLVVKTVTGAIIGTIINAKSVCNVEGAKIEVTFNIKAPEPKGTQEHELWTGNTYDLTSGPQGKGEDLTTSAQTGHGDITWPLVKPTLTC